MRMQDFFSYYVRQQTILVDVGCQSNGRRVSSISDLLAPAAKSSTGGTAYSRLPWSTVLPRRLHRPTLLPSLAWPHAINCLLITRKKWFLPLTSGAHRLGGWPVGLLSWRVRRACQLSQQTILAAVWIWIERSCCFFNRCSSCTSRPNQRRVDRQLVSNIFFLFQDFKLY